MTSDSVTLLFCTICICLSTIVVYGHRIAFVFKRRRIELPRDSRGRFVKRSAIRDRYFYYDDRRSQVRSDFEFLDLLCLIGVVIAWLVLVLYKTLALGYRCAVSGIVFVGRCFSLRGHDIRLSMRLHDRQVDVLQKAEAWDKFPDEISKQHASLMRSLSRHYQQDIDELHQRIGAR